MKQTVEITQTLREKLDICPNCGGPIEQLGSYKVRCKICRYTYITETLRERMFFLCFSVGVLCFAFGVIVMLFLRG